MLLKNAFLTNVYGSLNFRFKTKGQFQVRNPIAEPRILRKLGPTQQNLFDKREIVIICHIPILMIFHQMSSIILYHIV